MTAPAPAAPRQQGDRPDPVAIWCRACGAVWPTAIEDACPCTCVQGEVGYEDWVELCTAPVPAAAPAEGPGDPYEEAWNAAHADLLILNEADRVRARTLVADFAGGDFNAADGLIGLLHRNGFEVVSATAVVATLDAARSLDLAAAAPAVPGDEDERETGRCPVCDKQVPVLLCGHPCADRKWRDTTRLEVLDALAASRARPVPAVPQENK